MKIALIGYGKMGKAIEEIAMAKGHEIVLRINAASLDQFTKENIQKSDVCIEFTTPQTAFANVKKCLEAGVPVVCGSTAWSAQVEEAKQICLQHDTAFLTASNFSIGVNLFFKMNTLIASWMNRYPEYKVSMEEIHHTEKKDSPSGTAVTLAEGIIENMDRKNSWVNQSSDNDNELEIISKRIDPAPGTHSIYYHSDNDSIVLTHIAHNRKGFAGGALLAAEFLCGKKGVFTMDDVLGNITV